MYYLIFARQLKEYNNKQSMDKAIQIGLLFILSFNGNKENEF